MKKECVIVRICKDISFFSFVGLAIIVAFTMVGHVIDLWANGTTTASAWVHLYIGFTFSIIGLGTSFIAYQIVSSYAAYVKNDCRGDT